MSNKPVNIKKEIKYAKKLIKAYENAILLGWDKEECNRIIRACKVRLNYLNKL